MITAAIWFWLLPRYLGSTPLIRIFGPSLLAGAIMFAAVWAFLWATQGWAPWVALPAAVGTGAVVYLGVMWAIAGDELREGIAFLRDAFAARRSSPQPDQPDTKSSENTAGTEVAPPLSRPSTFKWKPMVARIGYESGAFGIMNRAWRNRLTTLTYHRIADPLAADFRGLVPNVSATPETFAAHLDLVQRWFNVIPLEMLLAWLRGGGDLPPRAALITFDDGYRDNLTAAMPALRARGLEATIFVTSGKMGSTEPFWWDHAAHCIANSSRARADMPLLGPQELGDRQSRIMLTQQWCSAASPNSVGPCECGSRAACGTGRGAYRFRHPSPGST